MRVIAGTRRSLNLKAPIGLETRPTTDRVKETLFNVLQPYLSDCIFVDLFSGSGSIGIEALSRGAKKCYFVEKGKDAITCINENLTFTKFLDQAVILKQDAQFAMDSIHEPVDVIFMDPPYNNLLEKTILENLKKLSILNEDTIIVIEASLETKFEYLEDLGFKIFKEKIYKTNKHVFISMI
jgi:16S rRNA (guanine966-N2)-methyltransferase